MRLFRIALLILLGISFSLELVQAGNEDGITSFTSFGTGIIFQSFELKKHLMIEQEPISGMLAEETLRQNPSLTKLPLKQLPVTWSLGMGYGRSTSAESIINSGLVDNVYSGTGSLTWDISSRLTIGARGNYDSIPNENYTHGMGLLHIEYTFLLPKPIPSGQRHSEPDYIDDDGTDDDDDYDQSLYDPNDARQYYRMQAEKKAHREEELEVELKANDITHQYPKLKLIYDLGFNRHTVGVKGGTPNTGVVSQSGQLNQYFDGPQITYMPNRKLTYNLAVGFYRYDNDVNQFLDQISSGDSLRQAILTAAGWQGFASQSLVLPSIVIRGMVTRTLTQKSEFTFMAQKVSYASSHFPSSYSINPIYFRSFKNHWRAGLGVQGTVGGQNSPFLVGTLQLDYRF